MTLNTAFLIARLASDPLGLLRRRWLIGVLCAVMIGLAGAPLVWLKGKPRYRSEAVLYISPRFLRNLEGDQENELQSNSQYREFVQQQVRTVNRMDIMTRVVESETGRRFWRKPGETVRRSAERLRSVLEIAPVPDTYQVTLALAGGSPRGLAEMLNTVAEEYLAAMRREALYDGDSRLKNLAEEKAGLERSIDDLIGERTAIAGELGTTVFNDSIINSYDRQLTASTDAWREAQRARFAAEAATPRPDDGLRALALEAAMRDGGLVSLKSTLAQRRAELLGRITGLSAQHPGRALAEKEIGELDRSIEDGARALEQRIADNLQHIGAAKLRQAQSLERKLELDMSGLRKQAERYSRLYQRGIELGQQIERTRRRLKAVDDRMDYLSLERTAPGWVRVFSPALPPELPFEGGRKKLALLLLVFAGGAGLAAMAAREALVDTVRSRKEMEALLGLPLTGVLPANAGERVDAARRIVAKLRRGFADRSGPIVVAVTGVGAESGAGEAALALGRAAAAFGIEAVVVDAQARAASQPGLLDAIAGTASIFECIAPGSPGRIGPGMFRGAGLLETERAGAVLETLSKQYGLVLLALDPVRTSVETEEMCRLAAVTILAARVHRDTCGEIAEAAWALEALQLPAFGAVLHLGCEPARLPEQHEQNSPALLAA